MERFKTLKGLFERRGVFKLVCGAGNEDPDEVKRLAMTYTLAGTVIHDVSANPEIVAAAKQGIDEAYRLAPILKRIIPVRPFINVSIGIKGDPHVRKAFINENKCVHCGNCLESCLQDAIDGDKWIVKEFRCIGCGNCKESCPHEAIEFRHKRADLEKILPECLEAGCETMELHAVSDDDDAVMKDWLLLNDMVRHNYISVCLDRSLLSNHHLIKRIKDMYAITGKRMIVQADGIPMSGEGDDFNTTLQAVACADIVIKSGIPVVVLISGGTNSKSGHLAKQCGVLAHGVAVGSYARKLVRSFLKKEEFMADLTLIRQAVELAENLVRANVEALIG